jgi:hypothetical protein
MLVQQITQIRGTGLRRGRHGKGDEHRRFQRLIFYALP